MTSATQSPVSKAVQQSLPSVTACISAASWADAVRAAATHLAATVGPVVAIARAQGSAVSISPTGQQLSDDQQQRLGQVAAEVFLRPEGWAADPHAFAVRSVVSRVDGQALEALVGFVTIAPSVPHLTAVSAALSAASSRELSLDCEREAETAGLIVDLIDTLQRSADRDSLINSLAQTTSQILGSDSLAVATRSSDRFEIEHFWPGSTPLSREEKATVAAACDEVHILGQSIAWPPQNMIDRPARRAIERAATLRDAKSAWAIPLEDDRGSIKTILFAWSPQTSESLERITAYWNPTLGAAVTSITDARASWWARLKRLSSDAISGRGLKLAAITAFVTAAVLAIPMPYQPKCECRLAPSLRRFVAAPFDATLKNVHVKPGDVVTVGDVMAQLDDREINWELAGIEAEINQATKRRNAALASANLAEAQIAEFDSNRLNARRDLLESRQGKLDIEATLAGIVVDGDLSRAEGMPLEIGQTLFEVAPLDSFVCEIHVPEFDIHDVIEGQRVGVTLDAQPGEELSGIVQRIRPQAETWDDAVGFVVEVELPNESGLLRSGMTGDARITTGTYPLARNLFHRAYGQWRRGW